MEEQLDKVSDDSQGDLPGNAMSFLVFITVAQSGFASLNWRTQSGLDEDLGARSKLHVDQAVRLLGMMTRNCL